MVGSSKSPSLPSSGEAIPLTASVGRGVEDVLLREEHAGQPGDAALTQAINAVRARGGIAIVIAHRRDCSARADMALFAVNTGCRCAETCGLRWDWEVEVPELDTTVFIVPGDRVKNGDEQLVVLNSIARSIIETVRGQHHDYVFTYRGQRVQRMLNSAWKKARQRANLPLVRVHDLKHTFGRRLRAAGVSFEDRQDFLGHRSRRITTHYSVTPHRGR